MLALSSYTTSKLITPNLIMSKSAHEGPPCNDNATWIFSSDDVRGQENDVQNNFGQAGSFERSVFEMYPLRAVPAERCEFCT